MPREQGIEGWLWTSTGGSALTVVGDEDAAPSGALLFTKPITAEQLKPTMEAHAFDALADRSPLGVPAVLGILFRGAELSAAETAFRSYGLLRPLTDPEVPPHDAAVALERQIRRSDGRRPPAAAHRFGGPARLLSTLHAQWSTIPAPVPPAAGAES